MNLGLGKAGVLGWMLIIGVGVGAQPLRAEPLGVMLQSQVQACAPIMGGVGEVVAVPAPLVLELGSSGERVRLIGLGVAPAAAQGVGHAFHLSALKQLVLGKKVQLRFNGPQQDRHGRTLAHVVVLGGATQVWLQAAMVAEGAALVDSWEAHATCTSTLLDLEKQARVEQKGLWANPLNAPVNAQDAEDATGRFAIVEGTVLAAAKVRGQIYLNFGDDWRTDFTIRLAPKTARRFLKENVDPLAFEGEVVRVRGFISWRGGPEILVTHPEQIERATSESLALRR